MGNSRWTPRGVLAVSGLAALLAGCATTPMGPTITVMPGPGKSFSAFAADQEVCKAYAAQQVQGEAQSANQQAAVGGAVTTVLGTGVGALLGAAGGNAGTGAAIGAGVGAGGGALYGAYHSQQQQGSIQSQYDSAYAQCMYAKGNQVPGFAPRTGVAPMPMAPQGTPAAMPAANAEVQATQEQLVRLGYLHGAVDGVLGPETRGAIEAFQRANNMPVTGRPSAHLLAVLRATPGGG